jgi:hypothetical protein
LRGVVLAVLLLWGMGLPAAAQSLEMRAGVHEGFGRLVFEWPQPVGHTARIEGDRLIVSFDRAVESDPAVLVSRLPTYLRAARREDGNRRIVFDLRGDHTLRTRNFGASVVLDLVEVRGAPPAASPSGQPAAASPAGAVPVRVGGHPDYTRLVFDWPRATGYAVSFEDGRAFVRFESPGRIDLARLRAQLPAALKSVREDDRNPLVVSLPAAALPKHFRVGANGIAIDVPTRAVAAPSAAPPRMLPRRPPPRSHPPRPPPGRRGASPPNPPPFRSPRWKPCRSPRRSPGGWSA